MSRPPHRVIQQMLAARGLDDPDGVGRAAKITRCRRCGRVVLRGLDGDVCAGPATTDLHALTPGGELAAVLAGRATYRLHAAASGQRVELHRRDDLHMATPPSPDVHVVATHHCDAGPLDHYPPPPPNPTQPTGGPDAPIPF